MSTADEAVDVVVVGAGPSGGVVAKHLAENGLSVVALEQGEMPDIARYTGRREEWELASQKQWASQPERPRARSRLSHRGKRVRHQPADVRRRRRQRDPLCRPLGALPAVRLPPQKPRRHRRRLAFHLRGPAARPDRGGAGRGGLRNPGQSGLSAAGAGLSHAAAADRQGRHEGDRGAQRARLALVAGHHGHRLAGLWRPQSLRAPRHLHDRLPGRGEVDHQPDPLARCDPATAPGSSPAPGPQRSK